MKKLVLALGLFAVFSLIFSGTGMCENISNIQLSPSPHASLALNQRVEITFDYTTNEAGGVRIFARPMSGGSLTPDYAAHGSPNYPIGSGSGDGYFTITAGDALVDEIQFRMFNDDQSVLLLEFFVPVHYIFSVHSVSNIQFTPNWPTALAHSQDVDITFDYTTDEPGGVRIFARPYSGGAATPDYSAHGSPNYAVGAGAGTAYFSINSGDAIVDQVRIQMLNDDQSVLLLDFFVPVDYHYAAHAISNIQFSPPPPASLLLNQDVDITFDYTTVEPGGVRIFARPYTAGSPTPDYAAHGSPNYPVGTGNGDGNFTITAGNSVVDEIRFTMLNDDQSVLLLEIFVPVHYIFSTHSVSNLQFMPLWPAYSTSNQNVDLTFDYATTETTGVRIFARPYSGGVPTPAYAAHGSPNYAMGTGNGSGYFTISSGNTLVDQVHIEMLNDDQSVQLLEFFIPVEYFFFGVTTAVAAEENRSRPISYNLNQNYPNPFNPQTKIQYEIPEAGRVTLKVYNTLGGEVRTLVDQDENPGYFEAVWDGMDNWHRQAASGTYIFRLESNGSVLTQKMTLLR